MKAKPRVPRGAAELVAILAANGVGCGRISLRCASMRWKIAPKGPGIRGCRLKCSCTPLRTECVMAQSTDRGGPAERPDRRMSEFIANLVKDPKNPPEIVEITGFLGAAAEAGRTRIYLDTTLQNYVEVMEDKILHVEPVEGGQLGLSLIF